MGVTVSHGCYDRNGISLYKLWTDTIAEAAGRSFTWEQGAINRGETDAFRHCPIFRWPGLGPGLDWKTLPRKCTHGVWKIPPQDPLDYFLAMSIEMGGYLTPRRAALVADRLEGLLPEIARIDAARIGVRGAIYVGDGEHVNLTQDCINGLRAASAAGERVRWV